MVKKSLVSVPGKIILSGEHSVVYGQPAVLGAVNRRLVVAIEGGQGKPEIISDEDPALAYYALQKIEEFLGKKINNLKIKIKSEIPVNRGMGSSAALSVAMVGGVFRLFNKKWDKNLIYKIAREIEKKQHQNSSGCDISISVFGGLIIFQKGKIKKLDFAGLPNFVLLDSGQAIESTGEMVESVKRKAKSEKLQRKTKNLLDSMGQITNNFIEAFKKGNLNQLKYLISENERILEELEVVGEKAKKIIREIEDLGGAAKICGAGGTEKGSGILLCYHQKPEILLGFAKESQIPSYQLKFEKEGLRNEN